jgi:hypothetical protein
LGYVGRHRLHADQRRLGATDIAATRQARHRDRGALHGEAGTLVMSAGLKALAFTGGLFDGAHWAQVAFGCFVPAAISGTTYILARLTRR